MKVSGQFQVLATLSPKREPLAPVLPEAGRLGGPWFECHEEGKYPLPLAVIAPRFLRCSVNCMVTIPNVI
jgi:hypothetical protein